MAADFNTLSKDMVSKMRAEMKKISSQAKKMEFQEVFTKAVSKGIIDTLKKLKSKGVGIGPMAGIGGGIALDPKPMIDAAMSEFLSVTGGKSGPAMKPILTAITMSVVDHFAKAIEVTSISGFGGQPLPPTGGSPKVIMDFIEKALPPELASQIKASKTQGGLIRSIATGLSVGLSAGIPGIIPASSPPPSGVILAVFK